VLKQNCSSIGFGQTRRSSNGSHRIIGQQQKCKVFLEKKRRTWSSFYANGQVFVKLKNEFSYCVELDLFIVPLVIRVVGFLIDLIFRTFLGGVIFYNCIYLLLRPL
jgi:hypothetical protein